MLLLRRDVALFMCALNVAAKSHAIATEASCFRPHGARRS